MVLYTDAHRAFLQMILKHRILSISEAKRLKKTICDQYECNDEVQRQELGQFIKSINNKILEMHMAIRKTVQENHMEDSPCYVLINNLNNELTRLNSSFNKSELGFIKHLIEKLIISDDGTFRETAALNLASDPQIKLGVSAAESLIDRLVHDKWILRNEGHLSFSCLTVCEIQIYLEENFADECGKCFFCKEYSFRGHVCPKCNTRGHRTCLQNYWKKLNKGHHCPNRKCGKVWEDLDETLPRKRTKIANDFINDDDNSD